MLLLRVVNTLLGLEKVCAGLINFSRLKCMRHEKNLNISLTKSFISMHLANILNGICKDICFSYRRKFVPDFLFGKVIRKNQLHFLSI